MTTLLYGRLVRLILAASLLFGAAACTNTLGDFDQPTVELAGLRPLPSQGLEARFAVRMRVLNPNTRALAIEGMAYDVYLREQKVLSGVSSRSVTVPAYGEETIELEASAGVLGSLALLRDLLAEPPDRGLPYRLQSKISLGGQLRAVRIRSEGTLDFGARPAA